MVDGIIQEVFKNWYMKYSLAMSRDTHNEILDRIQQELIEKIKLELLSIYEQNPTIEGWMLNTIQHDLIGDNQE